MSAPTCSPGWMPRPRAVEAVPGDVAAYRGLSDAVLEQALRSHARLLRIAESRGAMLAGEVARRSAPELGHDGLSQRSGHRTAIEFVRAATGSTARAAATSVSAGLLVHEAAPDAVTGEVLSDRPWLMPVGQAVASGALSPAAADSIRNGLGSPSAGVSADALRIAAEQLCDEAGDAGCRPTVPPSP